MAGRSPTVSAKTLGRFKPQRRVLAVTVAKKHVWDKVPDGDDWRPILCFLPAGASAFYVFFYGPLFQGVNWGGWGAALVVILLLLGILGAEFSRPKRYG